MAPRFTASRLPISVDGSFGSRLAESDIRGGPYESFRADHHSAPTTLSEHLFTDGHRDPQADRARDLLDRQFQVPALNQLLVADFTYVGWVTNVFVYVAFVIDAFAGRIIGSEVSASKESRFVESAIRQAAAFRRRQDHPIDGCDPPLRCRIAREIQPVVATPL